MFTAPTVSVICTIYYRNYRKLVFIHGSGYPRHLKGDQILLEARILAVADLVESIASFRQYRPQLRLEAALAETKTPKGVVYDATVVEICTALISRQGFDFETKSWRHHTESEKEPKGSK